jgi:hypothetical protein
VNGRAGTMLAWPPGTNRSASGGSRLPSPSRRAPQPGPPVARAAGGAGHFWTAGRGRPDGLLGPGRGRAAGTPARPDRHDLGILGSHAEDPRVRGPRSLPSVTGPWPSGSARSARPSTARSSAWRWLSRCRSGARWESPTRGLPSDRIGAGCLRRAGRGVIEQLELPNLEAPPHSRYPRSAAVDLTST